MTPMITIDTQNIWNCACFILNIPVDKEGAPIDLKFIPKNPTIKDKGKNIVAIKVKR